MDPRDELLIHIEQKRNSLPGLKKEIEDFLERDQSLRPILAEALLHLEKAQVLFQEGFDREITPQALRGVQKAREISLSNMLSSEIKTRLGVKRLDFGNPFTWTARILPAFDPPAMLAVVHEKGRIASAFGVATSSDTLALSIIGKEFHLDWSDPVANCLHKVNLLEFDDMLTLDGICYEIKVNTNLCATDLHFDNPRTQGFIMLENALYQVADEMVKYAEVQANREYVQAWKKPR